MNRAVSPRTLAFSGVALAAALILPAVAVAQDAPATAAPATAAPAPDAPAAPPGNYPPPPPRAPGGTTGGYPPANYPPQYQPPPGYYPPPPRAYRRNQWSYYPDQQPEGIYRPISLTLGIGPGVLWGPYNDSHNGKAALSYNIFRLGLGIAPNFQFTIAFEGTGASTTSPLTGENSWLTQQNWLLGLQYYFLRKLYVRGAAGVGTISEHTASYDASGGSGIAMSGGVGVELVQSHHAALGLDLGGSFTSYSGEHWETGGLNLAVTFY